MKKRALFVGVDEYEDGTISDLEHAVDDSESLAAAFETLLGFDRVEKLRNPAGKKDILGKVRELTAGLEKGDLFFFFFAGHGFRVKENHVLVCKKDLYADLEDEYDGLPVGQLKKRMRGPWNRMLVIDACQNDIRKTRGADEGIAGRDLALILEDGERDADNPDFGGEGVQVVVTSCSEGQKALEVEELGHGLFTSALLETVKEHAQSRTRLDMAGFRSEMAGRMGALARQYCLQGKQNPMFKVPGECEIVLLEGVPPASPIPAAVPPATMPATVPGEVCETCGRYRPLTELFRCRQCGKWHCTEHQDRKTWWCGNCTAKAAEAESVRLERERREEEEGRKAEEVERHQREAEAAAKRKEEEAAEARKRAEKAQRANTVEERWYQKGKDAYYGRGVAQSYAEAAKWYRKAAEQGHAEAQSELGLMYALGYGVEQSYVEAAKWDRKAAEQGHAGAQYAIGRRYEQGQGLEKSYEEAAKWYRKAAEQGHEWAQRNLGVMYENGRGVEQNDEEAVKWYSKAAGKGNESAKKKLESLLERQESNGKAASTGEWCVRIVEVGDRKLDLIRAVCAITGLDLTNGKKIVDRTPASVAENVSKIKAIWLKSQLEGAGARVEMVLPGGRASAR